jgi:hypothetical protein
MPEATRPMAITTTVVRTTTVRWVLSRRVRMADTSWKRAGPFPATAPAHDTAVAKRFRAVVARLQTSRQPASRHACGLRPRPPSARYASISLGESTPRRSHGRGHGQSPKEAPTCPILSNPTSGACPNAAALATNAPAHLRRAEGLTNAPRTSDRPCGVDAAPRPRPLVDAETWQHFPFTRRHAARRSAPP